MSRINHAPIILFMFSLLGLLTNECPAQDVSLTGKKWKVLADIPTPRFGGAAAVINNKLHVLGGVNMNPHTPAGARIARAVNLHHVYDPATNSWSTRAPIPDNSGWPAIAAYKGKIYLFGGDNKAIDASMTDTAWVYDPATDAWSGLAPLPHPRSYSSAMTVGERIYIFGARTLRSDGAPDRSTFRYHPATDTYTRMADLPEGARFMVCGCYKRYIYVVHGETDRETYAEGVLKYDVAANTWTKLNIPRIEQRKWYLSQHSTHVAIGSKLFILGGMSRVTNQRSARASYFDMEKETFGRSDPMPAGRCCGVAGVIKDKIYVAGGFWKRVGDVAECKQTWGYPFD